MTQNEVAKKIGVSQTRLSAYESGKVGMLETRNHEPEIIFSSRNGGLMIDEQTINAAIEIGGYYTAHAKASFSVSCADSVTQGCRVVAEKIRNQGWHEFNVRDVMRALQRFKTREKLDPVLEMLTEYGYIAPVSVPYSGTGRPANTKYLVNPKWTVKGV